VGRADLTLFAHVVGRPEPALDLAQAALLVAEPEYPGLDIPAYLALLDQLGAQARSALSGLAPGVRSVSRLCELLYQEIGFAGNAADYYDPKNSFLNEVLDRRLGIPITLGVVVVEVARRAGVPAQGVGFPGHFLVRVPHEDGIIIIDPFAGRLLDAADLRLLVQRVTGQERDPDAQLLAAAPKSHILLRMLANLRAIYAQRADQPRLRAVLERMVVLSPDDEALRRDLTRVGGEPPPVPSGGREVH
jgi:regulator of sirC expression with transglutaminase-like and TPR domain